MQPVLLYRRHYASRSCRSIAQRRLEAIESLLLALSPATDTPEIPLLKEEMEVIWLIMLNDFKILLQSSCILKQLACKGLCLMAIV